VVAPASGAPETKEFLMNRLSLALALGMGVSGAAGFLTSQSLLYGTPTPSIHLSGDVTSYRDIVKHVLPAVVSIESTMKAQVAKADLPHFEGSPFGNMPGLPDELRKKFEEFERQPFDAPRGHGLGSGFVIDPKGVIVTNDHVVRNASRVEVVLQDGRRFVAKDIKTDPKTDLAVLRIDAKEPLPCLEWGDSDAMEIGDRVLAVGAPLGMTGTVTSGIVSAKGRDIHMNQYEDFIQTDAAINPGNSGGPLVNLEGKVIGVNSAIKSGTGGFQGIGLAISGKLAQSVMTQLTKEGTVHRGYLGVQVQALDADVAARLGVPAHTGVVIGKVMPNTPAARAGFKDGDILATLSGKPVKDSRGLQRMVADLPLGKPVEVKLFRDGAAKTLHVKIEEQPTRFGMAPASGSTENGSDTTSLDKIGAKVADVTPEQAKQFGLPEKSEGVVVTEVEPDGVAARAGLRRGALIEKLDQKPVKTAEEVQAALDKASLDKGVLVQVKTAQNGTSYLVLKA
jgi:serine protease Do